MFDFKEKKFLATQPIQHIKTSFSQSRLRMKTIPDEKQWRILVYFDWEAREYVNYNQFVLQIDEENRVENV